MQLKMLEMREQNEKLKKQLAELEMAFVEVQTKLMEERMKAAGIPVKK